MFQDFPNRLIHKDETGAEWVSLYIKHLLMLGLRLLELYYHHLLISQTLHCIQDSRHIPWEPYVRDFDPTLNIRIRPIKNKLRIELPKYGDESFLDFGAAVSDVEKTISCIRRLALNKSRRYQIFFCKFIHFISDNIHWCHRPDMLYSKGYFKSVHRENKC